MDTAKLRAWWWAKQGLDGSLQGRSGRDALLKIGWARSVGGANPYITIFSRTGQSRDATDKEAGKAEIHELPSARGCTYVLPKEDFALALKLAQGQGEGAEIAIAKKFLKVTDKELDRLAQATIKALTKAPLDPKEIKDKVGDAARSLGEEGKKRGMSSTLPMVLGRLQTRGEIRRVPQEGRLDRQRYKYMLWKPNPLEKFKLEYPQVLTEIAKKYFRWMGPASVAHFQWFTGVSGKVAKEALEPLKLKPIEPGSELLIFADELDALHNYKAPKQPVYNLIAGLDSLFLLRRDLAPHIEEQDMGRRMASQKGEVPMRSLVDIECNAIVDRGRLIGYWEYDPTEEEIVSVSFIERNDALNKAIRETEDFIRGQLEDCRSFSLDSPESRRPKLKLLGQLASKS